MFGCEGFVSVSALQILLEDVASDATKVTGRFALVVLRKRIHLRGNPINCFVGKLLWIGAAVVGKNPDQSRMNLLIFLPCLFSIGIKPL